VADLRTGSTGFSLPESERKVKTLKDHPQDAVSTSAFLKVLYTDHPQSDFFPTLYLAPADEPIAPAIAKIYMPLSRDVPVLVMRSW